MLIVAGFWAFYEVCSAIIWAPLWSKLMYDPLHIYRSAEILRNAVYFSGSVALISCVIASICNLVVASAFLKYVKAQAK